jgi:hypothetical protein
MNFNKSKIQGNKKAIFSISLILLLTMTLMMALTQPSLAQIGIPQPEKTVGYIDIAPRLIGVGQQPTVNLWVFPLPTTYENQPYYKGFIGVTLTFVKPDGTKDTFMPIDGTAQYVAGETSALGSMYFYYTPTMAGNWSVSFTMPAQNITDKSGTVQFLGCTSNTAYFTVQTEPVLAGLLNGYPWAELPNANAYWSYPISANNREWYQISGDWLGMATQGSNVVDPSSRLWQPYGRGPNTGHIVWTYPHAIGGLVGGAYGSISYGSASGAFSSVVLDGKLFINIPNTTPAGQAVGQFRCIDEATGKVLYTASGSISNGIHLPGNEYAQAGVGYDPSVILANSYGAVPSANLFGISGSTWNYYDPLTGTLLRSITGASTGTKSVISNPTKSGTYYEKDSYRFSYKLIDGTNLAFGVDNGTLYMWNLTRVTNNNWLTGVQWTRYLPLPLANRSIIMIGTSQDYSVLLVRSNPQQYWGFSSKDGTQLWNFNLTYPAIMNEQITLSGVDDFIIFDPTESTFNCYSIMTGALLWTSPDMNTANSIWASTWTVYGAETNDNNNLYLAFSDGTTAALSLKDGHQVWRSKSIPSTEYTENAVPYVIGMVMVDGKIYAYAGYSVSYQIDPMPRFGMLICTNATTGDIIYTLNGAIYPSAAANGYVIGISVYNWNLYCIGKGTTSTTVTAQQQVGGSVLIQGSVLDKSPTSSDALLTSKYPNGVPAISDADMSVWMDYLHMQNATLLNTPPNCIGVPVSLDALDANGNYMHIGDVTSDGSGVFGYQWTPTTPGLYAVYATFSGSNSYFSSYADTRATVAATTTPAPTATSGPSNLATTSDLMTYIVVGVIAIIIAIAIVGALILRKKQ